MNERNRVGEWNLIEELGAGGNATVWKATRDGGATFAALKLIRTKKRSAEPYLRFIREVQFLVGLSDRSGVLPVLDFHLPADHEGQLAWLAMPIAKQLDHALSGKSLETIVDAVHSVATTLARLSVEHGVHHRDIKPANLYELDGEWLVGDFGLIDLPTGDDLTQPGHRLGPAHFMPYELITDPTHADGGPVDVYELGKTLWVLATEQRWPPEGHQSADDPPFRIADFLVHPKVDGLDRLVDEMTQTYPPRRPSMTEVVQELQAWRRREATPVQFDLAEYRAELQAKLAPHLAEKRTREEQIASAKAAVRVLEDRCEPLIEEVSKLYPGAEADHGYDKLSESLLMVDYIRRGDTIDHNWYRVNKVALGDERIPTTLVLRVVRAAILYADGQIYTKWVVHLCREHLAGSLFNESMQFSALVGTNQQDEAMDEFIETLGPALAASVKVLVSTVD